MPLHGGSQFPRPILAVSMAGLAVEAPTLRKALDRAIACGIRAVSLDASAPGLRPRELTRSARRDLAASFRRADLLMSGIDLWIPPRHFQEQATVDRAAAAVRDACGLVAELHDLGIAAPVVSLSLPSDLAIAVRKGLDASAEAFGATLADHTPSATDGAIGVDPASCLAADVEPSTRVIEATDRVRSARLSDWDGLQRVPVGVREGHLDLTAYVAAVTLALPEAPLIIDVRGLNEPWAAAQRAVARIEAFTHGASD